MDATVCRDQLKKEEDLSGKSLEKSDEVSGSEANMVTVEPPTVPANKGASLEPITPDHTRENGDFLSDFQSPLTLLSSPPNLVFTDFCPRSNNEPCGIDCSPRTPKDNVFNPFAPGPDEMMLAPQCKKDMGESRISVARRLNFDSSTKFSVADGNHVENLSDEEMLLESVYGSLLEAIVSKQTEDVLAEISPPELNSDGFKTPTSAPRLNGVAEICPGAPMKPTRKLGNTDLGLCRKLEF
ncbi:hypothetical protein L1049_007478 [Liquidambar formosana]|uniref:Uncharacterized protein n=1 Tax=Liquidambar formosana TaxID=63359 RepID=A0AAP0S1E7_LIQFO